MGMVSRVRHEVAGSLVLPQEEAVPAGLPDPLLHRLARCHDLHRQVVQNGGALDAGEPALDRRPPAERPEMRGVAIAPEQLAGGLPGAARPAQPASMPPVDTDTLATQALERTTQM